jgi:hypothetical protein
MKEQDQTTLLFTIFEKVHQKAIFATTLSAFAKKWTEKRQIRERNFGNVPQKT